MSYTEYRWDVFISYAHLDNQPAGSETGWVTAFVNRFRTALNAYLGASCSLLFDEALSGGNVTLDQLENAARNSAVLIGIGSPSYAKRPWLTKELNAFRSHCSVDERLFLVEKLPIDEGLRYPAPMDGKIAKRFWKKPENLETPIPLMPTEDQFNVLLLDVAKKVQLQLAALPGPARGVDAIPPVVPARPAKRLLIAQGTDDLTEQVEDVKRYLEQYPEVVAISPQGYYPQGGAEFIKAFDEDLSKADIFVQLLGGWAGRKTSGLEQGYTRYQFEAARKLNKKIMQWRHPELDLRSVSESYKSIVTDPNVTVCGLEEFKAMLLAAARTDDAPPPERSDDVFVNADKYNKTLMASLKEEFANARYRVAIPMFGQSTADNRKHLDKMLTDCNVIVFLNGSGDGGWFESQKRNFDSLRAKRKLKPEAVAVCTVPPGERPDPAWLGTDFGEIDCSDEYDPARVREFIAKLRAPPVKQSGNEGAGK